MSSLNRRKTKRRVAGLVVMLAAGAIAVSWASRAEQTAFDTATTKRLLLVNGTNPIKLAEVVGAPSGVVCAVHEDDIFSPELSTKPELYRLARTKPLEWVEEKAYGRWALAWAEDGKRPRVAFISQTDLRLLRPVDHRRLTGITTGESPLCAELSIAQLVRVESGGRAFVALSSEKGK